MQKRLYDFLEQHNILYKNQYGFRKNSSTTLAILEITEQIRQSIDNKKYGCGVFIDLRKAFDTVNHNILLKKTGPLWNKRNITKLVYIISRSEETVCLYKWRILLSKINNMWYTSGLSTRTTVISSIYK